MSVRAKFQCDGVTKEAGLDYSTIQLSPVINGSEENKRFWNYTPAGSISLSTTNESAAKQFEVGKEYYVDFTSEDENKTCDEMQFRPLKSEYQQELIHAANALIVASLPFESQLAPEVRDLVRVAAEFLKSELS